MLPEAPFAPISISQICLLSVVNALEAPPGGTGRECPPVHQRVWKIRKKWLMWRQAKATEAALPNFPKNRPSGGSPIGQSPHIQRVHASPVGPTLVISANVSWEYFPFDCPDGRSLMENQCDDSLLCSKEKFSGLVKF